MEFTAQDIARIMMKAAAVKLPGEYSPVLDQKRAWWAHSVAADCEANAIASQDAKAAVRWAYARGFLHDRAMGAG